MEPKVKGRECQNILPLALSYSLDLDPPYSKEIKKDWLMPITRGTLEPLPAAATSNYSKDIMVAYENCALFSRCLAHPFASFI